MLSLILSMLLHLISPAAVSTTPTDAHFVRTEVVAGSVWANVWETRDGSASLRTTTRLRDADPRLRFIAVDVDGDGRTDVIAFALDGRRLQVWRATDDGFTAVE